MLIFKSLKIDLYRFILQKIKPNIKQMLKYKAYSPFSQNYDFSTQKKSKFIGPKIKKKIALWTKLFVQDRMHLFMNNLILCYHFI